MMIGRESKCLIHEKPAVRKNLVHFVNKMGSAKGKWGGDELPEQLSLEVHRHTLDGEKIQRGAAKTQFSPQLV